MAQQIYIDPEQGEFQGDSLVQDIVWSAFFCALFTSLAVAVAWMHGLSPADLLTLILGA